VSGAMIESTQLTIDQALQQAVANHHAGNLKAAEELYRAILATAPGHPDANHNLGVLAVQLNQAVVGLPYLKNALEANPKHAQYWLSYIDALIKAGQTDNARQVLQQGRQIGLSGDPVDVLEQQLSTIEKATEQNAAQLASAISLREVGNYKEAQIWLKDWLDGHPEDVEALSLLVLKRHTTVRQTMLRTAWYWRQF